MAARPNWSSLPSVLIVDILSYLSHKDRLNASSSCKRWRNCLFHPLFWQKINFRTSYSDRQRTKFLTDRCGRFVRQVVINFDSHNHKEVRECSQILDVLCGNKNLTSFSLLPSSCHIEWPDTQSTYFIDRFLDCIESIIKNSKKLKHFSLGFAEELLEHSSIILDLLGRNCSRMLESLHIASIKEDSENYGIIDLSASQFLTFTALRHLSVDYDHMSNELLSAFSSGCKNRLETLVVNVHGIDSEHEKVTNYSWVAVRKNCPKLEVTVNLIHSYDGVQGLLDILQPALPLTCFRQMFCTDLNPSAINYFSSHYKDTLRSIYIIDGLNDGFPIPYFSHMEEDTFVMLAWRCTKLEEFTLLGYEILDDDIMAIARLRGEQLKKFDIPLSCIATLDEDEETPARYAYVDDDFVLSVSNSLKWPWCPKEDSELPLAVFDAQADAELAYIEILLSDQQQK
ncbi:FBXO33 [Mytilus coruscus]|uniref:FBXO33 n=1 Tax=Mytilus coruscus TaxID=42192 RepID=A0A6J8CKH3_MYTCO|nr:FBXO33 [Mytilus coruscus]